MECGGQCRDESFFFEWDNENCGGCGRACTGGKECNQGTCACPAGTTLCGDTCQNLQNDPNNCGQCETQCEMICSQGSCATSMISAGTYHTCAIKPDGFAYCWGANFYGQLGDGTSSQKLTPVQVKNLSGVKSISAGGSHTCAVLNDGFAYCWGANSNGQLGDGTSSQKLTPVQVKNLSGVKYISAGGFHTCAVLNDGSVHCWGNGDFGQLGDGTWSKKLTPVQVKNLSGVKYISAGEFHTCAVLNDGFAYRWGGTNDGIPQQIKNISNARTISTSMSYDMHTCSSMLDGTFRCWGWNQNGELGDGTTTNSSLPVNVVFP